MTEPHIQLLDDLGAEFGRIEAEDRRRTARADRSHRRSFLAALLAAALVGASLYAVPGTRAAVEDLTATFAGWIEGNDEDAPGTALRPDDDAPGWVRESNGATRLIAKTDGTGLYATRSVSPSGETLLNFSLGKDSTVVGDTVAGWRKRFDEHAVVVLGPAHTARGEELDDQGRFPLLGVTARSVDRVELRYATGPALVARNLDGGFVLLADSSRAIEDIVAYDAGGHELERTTVDVEPPVVGP
jgi:hypothetical protein